MTNEITAWTIYQAAFDSAIDEPGVDVAYVEAYAENALGVTLPSGVAEQIIAARARWAEIVESGEATANVRYHEIERPLSDIAL